METLFFIISKLVGYLIRIDVLIIIAVATLVLALFTNRHRVAKLLGAGLLGGLLFLAFIPVGDLMLRPFERNYPVNPGLQQVDGIIILGGAENVTATKYWGQAQTDTSAERLTSAVSLARRFPGARVIYAGGSPRLRDIGNLTVSEADIARKVLLSLGLDAKRLLFESTSRNTAENARRSLQLAQPDNAQVWVLITSAFHMPRAVRSFKRAGWTNIIPYPVDFKTRSFRDGLGWNLLHNVETINIVLKEMLGNVVYRLLGK